jgi:hydrogenase expression/formation protein HypE
LEPLGLIASGSLLIVINPCDTREVVEALNNNGMPAKRLGTILPKEHGLKIKRRDTVLEPPFFDRDEVTKIFG